MRNLFIIMIILMISSISLAQVQIINMPDPRTGPSLVKYIDQDTLRYEWSTSFYPADHFRVEVKEYSAIQDTVIGRYYFVYTDTLYIDVPIETGKIYKFEVIAITAFGSMSAPLDDKVLYIRDAEFYRLVRRIKN